MKSVTFVLVLLAACSMPPTPPTAVAPVRSPTSVDASFSRTWEAVIDAMAENHLSPKVLDRLSGWIATGVLEAPLSGEDWSWADCGRQGGAEVRPEQVEFDVIVRGDSAHATVRVTTRWAMTYVGTWDVPHLTECVSRGTWERAFETAVKAHAEGASTAAWHARQATTVVASFGHTWNAVIDQLAEDNLTPRVLDRSSGWVSTGVLSVPQIPDAATWADCGQRDSIVSHRRNRFGGSDSIVSVALLPQQVEYDVVVHGDSTRSTVLVATRWLRESACESRGSWEAEFEATVKRRATQTVTPISPASQAPHTDLEFGIPTLLLGGAHSARYHDYLFRENDTLPVQVGLRNKKPDIPAQQILVWGGAVIVRESMATPVFALYRARLQPLHNAIGTLYGGVEQELTWVVGQPLTIDDAKALNAGSEVLCVVAYATWSDDSGPHETDLSECLDPERSRKGFFIWSANVENNRRLP